MIFYFFQESKLMKELISKYDEVSQEPYSLQRTARKKQILNEMSLYKAKHEPGGELRSDGEIAAYLALLMQGLQSPTAMTPPSIDMFLTVYDIRAKLISGTLASFACEIIGEILERWPYLAQLLPKYTVVWEDYDIVKRALMYSSTDRQAVIGGMIGQCCADAVSQLVQGASTRVCKAFVDKLPAIDMNYGQYTEGSQMARELLITCSQVGKLDIAAYSLRMALFFQPRAQLAKHATKTTTNSCISIRNGTKIVHAGSRRCSDNGSVIRIAPIGWLFEPSTISNYAETCCSLTHNTMNCIEACIIMAMAVCYVSHTRFFPFSPRHFIQTILNHGNIHYKSHLPNYIKHVFIAMDTKTHEDVLKRCILYGLTEGEDDGNGLISSGVVQSFCYALYCFMKHPNDYVKCVSLAMQCGGDVVATSAMAGALCGSRVGIENIPYDWVRNINDMGEWRANELIKLVNDIIL